MKLFFLQTNKVERRVYLATDDEEIWNEAKRKFEGYTFVGDPKIGN